jgi:HrpA-like RNA helicase
MTTAGAYPGPSVRTVHRRDAPAARTPGRSDDPRRRPARPPVNGLRGADPDKVGRIAEQFAAAEALVATREAAVPTITYPDPPVSEKRGEIAKAITENQVVVVAGETGSGKTTQLPKICLELGRGSRGAIGDTHNDTHYPGEPVSVTSTV